MLIQASICCGVGSVEQGLLTPRDVEPLTDYCKVWPQVRPCSETFILTCISKRPGIFRHVFLKKLSGPRLCLEDRPAGGPLQV